MQRNTCCVRVVKLSENLYCKTLLNQVKKQMKYLIF